MTVLAQEAKTHSWRALLHVTFECGRKAQHLSDYHDEPDDPMLANVGCTQRVRIRSANGFM
jgi:hypothetical protein